MNKSLVSLLFVGVTLCFPYSPALAQSTPGLATVVTACGTPPSTYVAGQNRPVLQDTTGTQCAGTGGGGGTSNVNISQIGGTTVLTGAGATGAGSERTTVAQDTTTIAGSAPGTAGTPSTNVVSIQGVSGGTPQPVTQSVGTTFAPSQISLSTSSAQVLATLATPNARQVCNIDTAIIEYVGATGVTTTTGLPIYPGTCWDASHTTAAIFAVAASATPKVAVVQY